MSETITAMYDNRSDADAAADKLAEAGITRSSIQVMAGSEAGYAASDTAAYDHSRDEGGFWNMLKSLFMPEEDRYRYAEGMSRGSTVLTVTVEESQAGTANSILEEYGAIDVQQREAEWRAGGWGGYTDAGVPSPTNSAVQTPSGMVTPEPTDPLITKEEPVLGTTPASRDAAGFDDPATRDVNPVTRPLDRPASTNANALFGEDMTEPADPAQIPIGSPGARADAAMGSRVLPLDDEDHRDTALPQPPPRPTETRRVP